MGLRREDTGVYECEAVNILGRAVGRALVRVEGGRGCWSHSLIPKTHLLEYGIETIVQQYIVPLVVVFPKLNSCLYIISVLSSIPGYPLAANISPSVLVAGETFSLTCNTLYNYPATTITWARANDEPLPRRFSVNEQEQLVISPSTVEDEIEIRCAATNSYGRSNATASLTVYGES